MIVSELEIHKVIDLAVRPTLPSALAALVGTQPPGRATTTHPAGGICSEDGRTGRLHSLRFLLARGQYDVSPNMVADKMVGRAICDQVARLYDNSL
ncbi:MAG: flagellar biosynthesis anti-sigma factor FlgM [Thermoleophilia bacterium]